MRVIALPFLALAAFSKPLSTGSNHHSVSQKALLGSAAPAASDNPTGESYFPGNVPGASGSSAEDSLSGTSAAAGSGSGTASSLETGSLGRRAVTSTLGISPLSDVTNAISQLRDIGESAVGCPLSATNPITRHTPLRRRTTTRSAGKGKAGGPITGLFGSAIGRGSSVRNIVRSGAVRTPVRGLGSLRLLAGSRIRDRRISAYA